MTERGTPQEGPKHPFLQGIKDALKNPRERAIALGVVVLVSAGVALEYYSVDKLSNILRSNPEVSRSDTRVTDPYATQLNPTGKPVKISALELDRKTQEENFMAREQSRYFDDGLDFFTRLNNFRASKASQKGVSRLASDIVDNTQNIVEASIADFNK